MVIPQLNGTVKGLLVVAAIGMGSALLHARQEHVLTGWGTLWPALQSGSFEGFMAALGAGVTWLGLRSPVSQASKDDQNLVETVKAVTGTEGAAAREIAAKVKAEATDHVITKLAASGSLVDKP